MNKLLLCWLLAVLSLPVLPAQRPAGMPRGQGVPGITGTISGRIIDSLTRQPVEFATLLLKRAAGPEPRQIDGVVTDIDGNFKFEEVPMGSYLIDASFIGYQPRTLADITLTGKRPDLDLGATSLATSAALLAEAVVVGEAELIENRVDKVVYNASQDVANQGGDGADVLRRVPLLSVDLDGNVQLRGSSQVQILINGRPSSMFAGSVGEALQAMPADEIEKVEVVTSPGARYQGEGTAGIINIITKRGGLKGLTGSVDASIGTRSNNVGANLNYAKGRLGINGGLGSRFSWNRPTETFLFRRVGEEAAPASTLTQNAAGNSSWLGLNGNVGAFYDLNAFNGFTTSLRVRGRRRTSDLTQTSEFQDFEENIFARYVLQRENRGPAFNYDWTTDYRRKFDGEDHELNLAFQLGGSVSDQNYEALLETLEGSFPERDELGLNEGRNLEYTLQADYQRPINEKTFLETGAQGVLRNIVSDYHYQTRQSSTDTYTTDLGRSNVFDYDQNVYAAYLSLRQTFNDTWSAIAGVRYEGTKIAGALDRLEPGQAPFANTYDNWLPSASLQYKLSQSSSLRAAYTRRIQRPGLRYINPYIDESNPQIISVGNPELTPEVSDQVELTGNARVGKGFGNLSVFYKLTDGEFSEFVQQVNNVTRTTYLNLGDSKSWGANLFASQTVAKIIKLRFGINAERLQLVGSRATNTANLSRNVWQYGGNASFTLELPRDYVVESFGFYRAPNQTLQGEQASFSIWSIGAQKKLADDRWRIGVRIVEPFARSKEFPGSTSGVDRQTGQAFVQTTEYSVLFRSFGINARYQFGKLEGNRVRERRSKIDNNDVREGGGGEF